MTSNRTIGRVIATEKNPTTIDSFTFWTDPELILNPFDVIKVDHVNGSSTYGVIEDIAHITDTSSFLASYISCDFGNVSTEENTLRVGMNYVSAKVLCNDKNIYIPMLNNASVKLATKEEIIYALGLNNIPNPLVCGYLEMYNGTADEEKVFLPVHLNSKFIIGPEGAHLNISGISGLASKTSYAMFLLKAIQDYHLANKDNDDENDDVAFVLFNVKGKDLLAIDQENDFNDNPNSKNETLNIYKSLGLTPEPFKNVHYLFPYSGKNKSNTYMSSEELDEYIESGKADKYRYVYEDDKNNLDLMFANIDDTTQTMDSIINYIISGQGGFKNVKTWGALLNEIENMTHSQKQTGKEIPVVSWRKFSRIVNKSIKDKELFADGIHKDKHETRIEESLKNIKKNDVYVIDIAKLSEDQQAFVFGSAVRVIYDLQLGEYAGRDAAPPSKIIFFIDELNKYASKETLKTSPILRQVLDVAERGRSLGIVLFGAEQFRSSIHDRVTGNCSTHAYGRTNSIEISKSDYKHIPKVYQTMLTRLKQGEYIIQNPILRSLLHIKFPLPIYKQFK